MLFNGKLAFYQFPMLFNKICSLRCLGGDGRTYRRVEIHPCVLQDIGPLGPLPKKGNENERKNKQTNERTKKKGKEEKKRTSLLDLSGVRQHF